MADDQQTETEETETTDVAETEATESSPEAVLDAESAAQRETSTEELRELVDDQRERIEELEDTLLDLSTRVANGGSMGVCPDCQGAVLKVDPWFRSAKIKCTDCDRVFHEY